MSLHIERNIPLPVKIKQEPNNEVLELWGRLQPGDSFTIKKTMRPYLGVIIGLERAVYGKDFLIAAEGSTDLIRVWRTK